MRVGCVRSGSMRAGCGMDAGWGSGVPIVVVLGLLAMMFGLSAVG